MGRKRGPLNASERREKGRQAYQLAIRRITYGEIAEVVDISRQLVSTLVKEEQERQWADRDTSELEAEKQRSIATYEEVIRGAWQRLGKIKDSSLNVSGLFNVIVSAQTKIDDVTGVKAVGKDSEAEINAFLAGVHTVKEMAAEDMSE